MLCVAVLLSGLDHAGAFGYRDDQADFDRQDANVLRIVRPDRLKIRTVIGQHEAIVHLFGIRGPSPGDPEDTESDYAHALVFATHRAAGHKILLRLDSLRTRDDENCLLAFVFLSDTECLNVELARNGLAFADAKQPCELQPLIVSAQTLARHKRLGIWQNRG